jgi:hypothetical protein
MDRGIARELKSAAASPTSPAAQPSRFLDARTWGNPVIDEDTTISAPFGWTGLTRTMARKCGTHIRGFGVHIRSLSIMPSGIEIEISERYDRELVSCLYSIAHEIGQAASGICPETGLLKNSAIRELLDAIAQPTVAASLELQPIVREFALISVERRRPLLANVLAISEGYPPPLQNSAPVIAHWLPAFPPGAETLFLEARLLDGSHVSEPLIAVDRLRHWACTTRRAYYVLPPVLEGAAP